MTEEVTAIQVRNARVESDKAWETCWTRRIMIAVMTYIVITLYLWMLGVANNYLHALVPAIGYLLSTLTLPYMKKFWLERIYKND